ncbi:Obg-like ATPase 1 [Durusdinium trenchii]
MYAVNMNKHDYCRKKNKFLKPIYEWVQANSPGSAIIPYCGAYEEELQDMETEEDREKQLKEDGVTSAMPKMISTAFHMVHLINFFTAGPDEVKAWTVRKGFKAPQAAGVIHTDFEKGFIMAEVMSFTDLKELGSEANVKAAGKYRQEGKNYEVQSGDVIFFKFNLGKGK